MGEKEQKKERGRGGKQRDRGGRGQDGVELMGCRTGWGERALQRGRQRFARRERGRKRGVKAKELA